MAHPRAAFAHLNISNPLVAWLVYRGEIVSAARAHEAVVSFWLMRGLSAEASMAHRGTRFRAELALEERRLANYPESVSRLRCFYAFDDASAQIAIRDWGPSFSRDNLAEIGIADSLISRRDAQWITHHLGSDPSDDWIDAYLQGEARGDDPIWELLVDGRARVWGTRLRETAYGVIKRVWPASIPLLELSRLGVELGSDLGLIAPMVLGTSGDLRVDFTMSFADATNPDFLERLGAFDGPRNTSDLRPDSELILPDLRRHGFKLS